MIRVGILGAGTVVSFQAPGIARIPDVEIAGFYDPGRERAEKMAAKFGGRVYETDDALIGDDSLDAVLVMSPTPFHQDQVLKSFAAGRHVFCEKPIARHAADAARMMAAAKSSGRVFMVGMVVRFFHEFERAHRLVKEGALGRVGVIRTTRAAGYPRGWNDWYADVAQSGGVIVDMVAHDFDWLRWTLGPVESVFSRTASWDAGERRDYWLTVLRFRSGALAHVEASWAHLAGFFTRLEIAGSEGLLSFDSRHAAPLRITKVGGEGPAAGVAVPESPVSESPYQREMAHFFALLRGEAEPLVAPEDAVEALKISLAARISAETGRPVNPAEVR